MTDESRRWLEEIGNVRTERGFSRKDNMTGDSMFKEIRKEEVMSKSTRRGRTRQDAVRHLGQRERLGVRRGNNGKTRKR